MSRNEIKIQLNGQALAALFDTEESRVELRKSVVAHLVNKWFPMLVDREPGLKNLSETMGRELRALQSSVQVEMRKVILAELDIKNTYPSGMVLPEKVIQQIKNQTAKILETKIAEMLESVIEDDKKIFGLSLEDRIVQKAAQILAQKRYGEVKERLDQIESLIRK